VLTIATPEGVEMRLTLAGPASRFVSATVDIVIQTVLLICLAIVLGVAGDSSLGGGAVAVAIWFLLSFLVITLYDVFFEVFNSGRTPGKRLNGLRVVRVEGHPVTFLTSMIRNIIRPIDFLPSAYLLGAVVILATSKNQRLGDIVAGTIIVRDRLEADRPAERPRAPFGAAPREAITSWDTTQVTADELAAVRQFLERRGAIESGRRRELAATFAERLKPKVAGAPAELTGEQFLLALVEAKTTRSA
jgi:uncharacterized RDD family membrane protein YckC